ncbi:hypothetical protein RR46_03639 [Papilio xuthus]|uniref:Uncharacterized protein n=1 Tax=Papilio xuthus TaxID=66420 RepID=A0A194PYS2_PAPXU|nr:hypothetical protein RR46_03639 [Papilio xuthus]
MRSASEERRVSPVIQDELREITIGRNLRPTESTTTLQSKASDIFDIGGEFSSESIQDIDSLLRVEDQRITADLIAKLKKTSKPSISEVTKGDETAMSVESGLIISKLDMKNVDDYILERQEEEGEPLQGSQQEEIVPVATHDRLQSTEIQSTSRANRHFFHVHYKDDDEEKDNKSDEKHNKQDSLGEASRKDVLKGIKIKDDLDTPNEDAESENVSSKTKIEENIEEEKENMDDKEKKELEEEEEENDEKEKEEKEKKEILEENKKNKDFIDSID